MIKETFRVTREQLYDEVCPNAIVPHWSRQRKMPEVLSASISMNHKPLLP